MLEQMLKRMQQNHLSLFSRQLTQLQDEFALIHLNRPVYNLEPA